MNMTPGEQVIYNTMCAILEKLNSIETNMKETGGLADYEGMTIQDIADYLRMSLSQIRKKPWYMPFENPEYGRSPFVYSRAQVLRHMKLIDEKGFTEVERMWQNNVKAKRRKI